MQAPTLNREGRLLRGRFKGESLPHAAQLLDLLAQEAPRALTNIGAFIIGIGFGGIKKRAKPVLLGGLAYVEEPGYRPHTVAVVYGPCPLLGALFSIL